MKQTLSNPSATAHHPFRTIHESMKTLQPVSIIPQPIPRSCIITALAASLGGLLFSLKHEKLNLDQRGCALAVQSLGFTEAKQALTAKAETYL